MPALPSWRSSRSMCVPRSMARSCSMSKTGATLWSSRICGALTAQALSAIIASSGIEDRARARVSSLSPALIWRANIGIIDRLFSRVGAADDLAHGRSTFMVEMVETASILNQATERSFVVLDEIGRGTATFDGLSIAWAALEYLHEVNRSRVLFATHYHELTALADKLP